MKKIIAVSGGVDSVVLLDMLVRKHKPYELVVAHFEHGIRGEESRADARFVEALSQRYGLVCEVGHGGLSSDVSESEARAKRYEFLSLLARQYDGAIVTAHHQDDLIETIALNVARGTGWRGLSVFGNKNIERPLLSYRKRDLYKYALRHSLEWVEDETNQTDTYTRNKLRRRLWRLSDDERKQLVSLHDMQWQLREVIDGEMRQLGKTQGSRYFFTMLPDDVAIELLRHLTNARVTRPQLRRMLLAIKTARPGTATAVGGKMRVDFTLREFFLKTL